MKIFARGARGAALLRWGVGLLVVGAAAFIACMVGTFVVDGMVADAASEEQVREVRLVLRDIALPGFAALIVGLALIIPGELRRRGRWQKHDRSLVQGGIHSIEFGTLSLGRHAAWFAIISAVMLATTVVPLVSAEAGGWPVSLDYDAAADSWYFLSLFGSLARIAWVMVGLALLKKAVALRHPAADVTPSRVWRWLAYRWRVDVALGFIAGIAFNVAFVEAIDGGGEGAALLAGALVLLATPVAFNYWRSGKPLGSIESVA